MPSKELFIYNACEYMGLNPLIGLYPVKQCWVINSSSFTTKVESFRSSVTFVGKSLVRISCFRRGSRLAVSFLIVSSPKYLLLSEMGSPSEQRKLSTKLLEKPHPASRPAAAMLCSRMFVL